LQVLSLLARRSEAEFERSQTKAPLAQLAAGLLEGRAALVALGGQFTGALACAGRALDMRMLADVAARAGETLAGWLILGGVLAMPVAAICAALGALLPSAVIVHQHAGAFFTFATVWFLVALLAAQFQRRRRDEPAAE
jgi:hypothetical protein